MFAEKDVGWAGWRFGFIVLYHVTEVIRAGRKGKALGSAESIVVGSEYPGHSQQFMKFGLCS